MLDPAEGPSDGFPFAPMYRIPPHGGFAPGNPSKFALWNQARCGSSIFFRSGFGNAPTLWSTGLPPLNRISVGMPRTW
jgi:hypothetical protein